MSERLRSGFRRHERVWILGYLFALGAGTIMLAVPATRGRILAVLAGVVATADRRWDARLQHGLALADAGAYEEAARYLQRLDQDFPAPTNRASRDRDREALLLALARSHEMLGRRGRSVRTYQQLVAFDPRNYQNHYALGTAHLRLAQGWSVPTEAEDAFRTVLTINPNHLPSVREVMRSAFERGEFPEAVRTFEHYLDASLTQQLLATVGDSTALVRVPFDGRPHEVRLLIPPTSGPFVIELETKGFTMALGIPRVTRALRWGVPPVAELGDQPLAGEWVGDEVTADAGRRIPTTGDARVRFSVVGNGSPVTEVRFSVQMFKPVDPETWSMAQRSYHNLLRDEGFVAAAGLAQLQPVALADSVRPYVL